jgi:hypothetical protein
VRLLRPDLNPWLLPYLMRPGKRCYPRKGQAVELLLCIVDHFEPDRGNASPELARARVQDWVETYPRLFGRFRDSDARPPRHSFFYPMEQYKREHLDALTVLCQAGFGEVEIHLHHDGENAAQLRSMLLTYRDILVREHGLLSRHKKTGEIGYAFVHGDWALDNSRPDGRKCGVPNELNLLRETGCYCDFTLPSAPDEPTQTRKINSIYYAAGHPERSKGHDCGIDVGCGPAPRDALMLIQGPLLLDWKHRKHGLFPRVENGCVQANQPARAERIDLWLKARIQVPSRPDWFFVKLHTHGAPEANRSMLLGEPMVRFHEALARRAADNPQFRFHYVTAREMYNLAKAAEAGWQGSVAEARDFMLLPNAQAPEAESHPIGAPSGTIGSPAMDAGTELDGKLHIQDRLRELGAYAARAVRVCEL